MHIFARGFTVDATCFGFAEMDLPGFLGEFVADIIRVLANLELNSRISSSICFCVSPSAMAIFSLPRLVETAGAISDFWTACELHTGHATSFIPDWRSKSALSRNQPSNSWP